MGWDGCVCAHVLFNLMLLLLWFFFQDITHMGKTLERLFEQKLLMMPKEVSVEM